MSTTFYIKQYDTSEELKLVMKKRQAAVNGVTPPDTLWLSDKTIDNVFFSMAKIPQLQADGSTLYPDGTIHKEDGTILNPLTNTAIYLSGILLLPGEILNEDYSVTKVDGSIQYPTGLILNVDGTYNIPNGSYLLPNGMVKFPANNPYPTGYIYNPGDIDRTNFYKVGNPTDNDIEGDGSVLLPDDTTMDATFNIILPSKVLPMPTGSTKTAAYTVLMPSGSTKESSTQYLRDNVILLPSSTQVHSSSYTVSYSSTTKRYSFPSGSIMTHYPLTNTCKVFFPDATFIYVPYSSFEYAPFTYVFPYGTIYTSGIQTFIFPGETYSLPRDAVINVLGLSVSVTFNSDTVIDDDPAVMTITLQPGNQLLIDGDVLVYDSSKIKLNTNYVELYNTYTFYPRGTQKNTFGTIIHPDGYSTEGSYLRYYPTEVYPAGLLVTVLGYIVNVDGTFTRLDNSIIDSNGTIIQPAHTEVDYYSATVTPPFVPTYTGSSVIVINHATGSYEEITYTVTGSITAQATLLKYQWRLDGSDTSRPGLYSAEYDVVFDDGTKRTMPIASGDALLVQVLEHFSTGA